MKRKTGSPNTEESFTVFKILGKNPRPGKKASVGENGPERVRSLPLPKTLLPKRRSKRGRGPQWTWVTALWGKKRKKKK